VQAQEKTSDEVALGEIVVTAQRRTERLQDVPIAVTALDTRQMQNRQMTQMVDMMATVPNMHASNNIGQGSATTVFIRGVGETELIVTIDPPVGFYIDDVIVARQGVNNMALFDIERIEVLRGPQGTLYGRNTSAGAVKLVTVRPSSRMASPPKAAMAGSRPGRCAARQISLCPKTPPSVSTSWPATAMATRTTAC